MSGIARMRLREERKQWRKEHKWGFYARETQNADGTKNIFKWEAGIPGKEKVWGLNPHNTSVPPFIPAIASNKGTQIYSDKSYDSVATTG